MLGTRLAPLFQISKLMVIRNRNWEYKEKKVSGWPSFKILAIQKASSYQLETGNGYFCWCNPSEMKKNKSSNTGNSHIDHKVIIQCRQKMAVKPMADNSINDQ